MKKLLSVFIVIFMTISVFSQDLGSLLFGVIANEIESKRIEEASKSELLKSLEKNNKKNIEISGLVSVNGFVFNNYDNTFSIPELKSDKFTIIAEIETEFLNERINYLSSGKVEVTFVLKNSRPKTYALTKIEGLETVAEYKARIEAERLAKLEAERLAKIETERIAEENRKKLEIGLPIYKTHLSKAKEYERKKRWCYALGSYYDALGVDIPVESKQEARDGFIALQTAIKSGNPGLDKYDMFTIYDEWKKLLIDAEKYGSSFSPYELTIGVLTQSELNYENRTATYTAPISCKFSNQTKSIIGSIQNGYKKAYREDWKDLPENWPLFSASYREDNVYLVDGVCIFCHIYPYYEYGTILSSDPLYYNSFALKDTYLREYKFALADKENKNLVISEACLLSAEEKIEKIQFKNITPEIMEKIDNGVFVKPIEYYLYYGINNKFSSKKNVTEKKVSVENTVCITQNNKSDEKYERVLLALEGWYGLTEFKKDNDNFR